jgi:inorganic phosphate transporter, PiT family
MTLVVVIIILALIFDYINGFHDAANSIATIVSTKVLTPFQAVLWASLFNFVAYFIFKDHAVANTIGKTVIDTWITLPVILAGLIAAIFWNLLTWWYGIPSSSSHTLIGGFAGAAVAHAFYVKGWDFEFGKVVEFDKIVKTVLFIFLAPLIGMVISMFITLVTIMRNTWVKIGIIILASMATWYMFDVFKHNKMEEGMVKFFRVDKYKKDLQKAPDSKEAKEKLEKATANLNAAKPFLKHYNKEGADKVASEIEGVVSFKDLEVSKLKDAVNKLLKADALKKAAFYDAKLKPKYDSLVVKVDGIKPILKQYRAVGKDSVAVMVGAALALQPEQVTKLKKSFDINLQKDLSKEIAKADNSMIIYSLLGLFLIFILVYIYSEKIKTPTANRMASMFKRLQLLSSAAFSIGHGGNDAQKVMGIIGAALVANGNYTDINEALKNAAWVPLACYAAIGLGTLSGGWKIVKTMGTRITKVTPLEGVSAETSGALTLFMTEQMGIPVSTTHTITGAIIGVGATKRLSAVRWGVTRNLLVAWILTIPVSAIVAGLVYYTVRLFM